MSTCVYVLTSHNDITWSKSFVITGQNNRFAARRINALPVSVVSSPYFLGLNSLILHTNKIAFKRFQMVNLNKIYNSCMYNYYDYSIQYKKLSNLEELTKKFFKVERDWGDSVTKTGYYIEIEASSEVLVTRGCHTFKNENRKLGVSRVCYSSIFQSSDIRGLQ